MKNNGLNPGRGWTCHQVGFFGCLWRRWHLPTVQRAVAPPSAALAPLAPHYQDNLQTQQKEKTHTLTQSMSQCLTFNEYDHCFWIT